MSAFGSNGGVALNREKFIKNILFVIVNNGLNVLVGVLTGFFIPKIMGMTDYGYYKTFGLYISYIGLLHFGFLDGVLFVYAGTSYEDLDVNHFRFLCRFLAIMEGAFTLLGCVIAFCVLKTGYFYLFLFTSLDLFAVNMTTFYEDVAQITMQFKRFSLRGIVKTILTVGSVSVLIVFYYVKHIEIPYYFYILIVVAINFLLLCWYVIGYREITFGKMCYTETEKKSVKRYFALGFPILISNLVFIFIFAIDQQFVNVFFSKEDYAVYAFAYNMLNIITLATNAISTVLFPTIKKMQEDMLVKNYTKINSYLLMFVSFYLLAYFVLIWIVEGFLTKYQASLGILRVILPGVLITSNISVIKYNFFKRFEKVKAHIIIALSVLGLAAVADLLICLFLKSMIWVSGASIIVCMLWYLACEFYFSKTYGVKWLKNFLFLSACMAWFYATTFLANPYLAFCVYFVGTVILNVVFYPVLIKSALGTLKEKIRKRKTAETTADENQDGENGTEEIYGGEDK